MNIKEHIFKFFSILKEEKNNGKKVNEKKREKVLSLTNLPCVSSCFKGPFNVEKSKIIEKSFKTHWLLFSAVKTTAMVCSSLHYNFFLKGEPDNPLLKKLGNIEEIFKRPNEIETIWQIFYKTYCLLQLEGEAYWRIKKDNDVIENISVCPGGSIKLNVDSWGKLLQPAYIYEFQSERVEFKKDEIIPFILPDPYNIYAALSPIGAMEMSLAGDIFASKKSKQDFERGGLRKGIFVFPENISDDEFIRLKSDLVAAIKEASEADIPFIIVRGEIDYRELEKEWKGLNVEDERKRRANEILSVLGIPKIRLGMTEDINKATAEELHIGYIEDTINPLYRMVEGSINKYLHTWSNGIEIKFEPAEIIGIERLTDLLRLLLEKDGISIDEIRRAINLSPLKNENKKKNDEHYQSADISQIIHFRRRKKEIEEDIQKTIKLLQNWFQKKSKKMIKYIEKVLKGLPLQEFEEILKDAAKEWEDLMSYEDAYNIISKSVFRTLNRGWEDVQEELDFLSVAIPATGRKKIEDRLEKYLKKFIVSIFEGDETRMLHIKEVVISTIEKGWSIEYAREQIKKIFQDVEDFKIERLVRTETGEAYNIGKFETYKEAKIKHFRFSLGARPCPRCVERGKKIFTIEELEGIDYDHPNGACVLVPIIE